LSFQRPDIGPPAHALSMRPTVLDRPVFCLFEPTTAPWRHQGPFVFCSGVWRR
jgi:hypothetical protein